MSSKARFTIAVGVLLILVSVSVRSMIFGAERQARELAGESWEEVKARINRDVPVGESSLDSINDTTNQGQKMEGHILVLSQPLMARLEVGTESFRTPAVVPEVESEYRFSTRYREGAFSGSELKTKSAVLRLKTPYFILSYLFVPGLLLLWLATLQARKDSAGLPAHQEASHSSRPSTVKDGTSSLDTVFRTAPPPPPDGLYEHSPSTPQEVRYGRFVRGVEIGKGAMGQVYRCTSCLPGDSYSYALKVLLPEWSKSEDFRVRFEREVEVCRMFAHPNLVRAYDHGEKSGRLWMVMDYVDGPELTDWLAEEKRNEQALVTVFLAIFRGLDHAHRVGVVHRDLKPGNILVRRDNGQPVIADFGLARGKHYATITKTNTTLGTPNYMAPEQITGGKGSPQSDLYSVGTMMYEALVGAPPFDEQDVMTLLALKLTTDSTPKLPEEAARPELRAIVNKLLARDLKERYQTASEVIEALVKFSSGI
ncbi:MAG: serine/threonine-protein kinase [Vulcanimicrobiota bacterium]